MRYPCRRLTAVDSFLKSQRLEYAVRPDGRSRRLHSRLLANGAFVMVWPGSIRAREGVAMLPGINTDVTHEGVTYHVQTEDLGTKNPTILTLVYRDGAVVFRDTFEYGQTLVAEPSASLLKSLMDGQHRRVLRHVSDGALHPGAQGPEPSAAASPPQAVEDLIEVYLLARRRNRAQPPSRHEP